MLAEAEEDEEGKELPMEEVEQAPEACKQKPETCLSRHVPSLVCRMGMCSCFGKVQGKLHKE